MNSSLSQTSESSLRFIRGIGPKRLEALKRLGVNSIRDLCYFFPRRYEDRSHLTPISEIIPGQEATLMGQVLSVSLKPLKRMTLLEVKIGDETGFITAVWFNQPYLRSQFQVGEKVAMSGKAEAYQGRLQINSPEYEQIDSEFEESVQMGRITPIYPMTEGLQQRPIRVAIKEVIDRHLEKEVADFLPPSIKASHHFMELTEAIRAMHYPDDFQKTQDARRRLAFDEFFLFQTFLLSKVKTSQLKEKALLLSNRPDFLSTFKSKLPFALTENQETSIREIIEDVSSSVPMNRLLQGEVGAGKTVIAAFLLALGAVQGIQGALLVPTELLAEQHAQRLNALFQKLGISSALLTGSLEPLERERVIRGAKDGSISVLIGTHALLQEDVFFHKLGVVVIDEQHRFGVRQRAHLLQRNPRPHLLVMTATPIPRTLGLSLYGDFNISTLRELPKGRKPVKTVRVNARKEQEVLQGIKDRILSTGEQAYILFPIIDETENLDVQAAAKAYQELKSGIFQNIPIGLLHGRLSKKDRDEAMKQFSEGKTKILVATSVIEVGVDNPNVTQMVIEHSERFGLSQLHQMRGRIGRGDRESVCYLFGIPGTEEAKKRIEVLTAVSDGFQIAEADLLIRGPGDFFGTRQSGLPFFQVADLIKDQELLLLARGEAKKIIESDPELVRPEDRPVKDELERRQDLFFVV